MRNSTHYWIRSGRPSYFSVWCPPCQWSWGRELSGSRSRSSGGSAGTAWACLVASCPDPGCSETQKRSNTVKLRSAQCSFSSSLPAPAPLYPELLTGILSTTHLNLTDAQSTTYLLGMKHCSLPGFFLPSFNILMEASSRLYEREGKQSETPALGKQCFSEGYNESYNLTKFPEKRSATNNNRGVSETVSVISKENEDRRATKEVRHNDKVSVRQLRRCRCETSLLLTENKASGRTSFHSASSSRRDTWRGHSVLWGTGRSLDVDENGVCQRQDGGEDLNPGEQHAWPRAESAN